MPVNKILIVEDNQKKADKLKLFLETEYPSIPYDIRMSYNSALKEISINSSYYDLILLDMSMQTYDISAYELGGEPIPLAGKNILNEIYLRDIKTKVVVVTMYENYIDGTKIKLLHENLKEDFSDNYLGYVYFSHSNNDWKVVLGKFIKELL